MTQPNTISTTGVRQDASFTGAGAVVADIRCPGIPAPDSARGRGGYLVACAQAPKRKFVMESICAPHGCMAVPPKRTGAAPPEVLYVLLGVRIIGLRTTGCEPDVFVPIYAQIEHIRQ